MGCRRRGRARDGAEETEDTAEKKHNETTDAEGQTVRVQRHRTKDSREKEGRMGDRRL